MSFGSKIVQEIIKGGGLIGNKGWTNGSLQVGGGRSCHLLDLLVRVLYNQTGPIPITVWRLFGRGYFSIVYFPDFRFISDSLFCRLMPLKFSSQQNVQVIKLCTSKVGPV